MKKIKKILRVGIMLFLTSCSVWQDEFDEPVPRAMPKASIHKVSTLVDKGVIKESDVEDSRVDSFLEPSSASRWFKDGTVSRGTEDVRRIYLMAYEDSDKTFHAAHHLYAVIRPASWMTQQGKQK